jgi:hypothetical protein
MKIFSYFIIIQFLIGCYSLEKKYNYGEPFHSSPDIWTEDNPQFESGKHYAILDEIGDYVFSLPSKLILLNWKADNHKISNENKKILENYIRENNIRSVKVRFNQYAPGDELLRLVANNKIHPVVKYTAGLLGWLMYSLIPERLFAGIVGGDHYNPFSNSLHIYSDLASVLIHEGGHAKDFNQRESATLYAAIYSIPIIGTLYHESVASDDALSYFAEKGDDKSIEESYKILVPAYSTYLGGSFGDLLQTPYSIAAVVPGHIYGRYKACQFQRRLSAPSDDTTPKN